MKHFILAILALAILAPHAEAADGRRSAFVGGLVVGLVGGFVARDAMEVKPAPQVVYVESQPRTVIVERQPQVVYVERPQVVYVVERQPQVVYVEVRHNRNEVREWTPPKANPFPQ